MKPVAGIIPSGILATNEISATALNFTSGGAARPRNTGGGGLGDQH